FDDGWEAYRHKALERQIALGIVPPGTELSRDDPDVPEWHSFSAEQRRLFARMMEVYAGFLTHTDHHIGRLLDFLETFGELDNTLVMLISDNGASSEGGPMGSVNENLFFNNVPEPLDKNLELIDELGGPTTFNHYPWGWTWAGNAPFRRWKRETYRGGISDPLVVHWPAGIAARGEVRTQYTHAIDLVPTVLESLSVDPPAHIRGVAQSPIEGVSFAHTFGSASAPSKRVTQYFEMLGHRSLYHDGWRAVCPWPGPSFAEAGMPFGQPISKERLTELDHSGWELYHVEEDVAENHDVADQHRDRLIAMIATWYVEAGKYNVLPIDGRGTIRFLEERPQISPGRSRYTYYPRTEKVPTNAAVSVLNRPHSITADVEVPPGGADGILVAHGGIDAGYALFVRDRRLCWVHNYVALEYPSVIATTEVPEGRHRLRFEFEVTGAPDIPRGRGAPGRGLLYIDEELVGAADVPVTTPLALGLTSGLAVGSAPGAPVCPHYEPPFEFGGTIHSVDIDVSGELIEDDEATLRRVMARQ
ncbi:MAG TPA: sulfatase-like hydrolase/transferase, partial [Acidimicrobiales bacterium]|nr:sulfatase-like hydrolase/transferase [Acidimicrobiales bacterium]